MTNGLAFVLGLGAAVAAIRVLSIWRGWTDGEIVLADDAFYYFQIARNVAAGRGPTFDALAVTNGFHPLYLVLLSGLYEIWPQSPWIPIHAALTLLVACDLVSATLMYRIAALHSERAGVIAATMWLAHPMVVATSHRGLESSLSTMLVLGALGAYQRWLRMPEQSHRGALLGVVGGLAVLARTENVLFVLALGVHVLFVRPRHCVALARSATVPLVAMLGPWLIWQWTTFGTLEQSSGLATRLFRIYGNLDSGGESRFSPGVLSSRFGQVLEWVHRCALAQEFEPLRGFGRVYFAAGTAFLAAVGLGAMYTLARQAHRRTIATAGPLLWFSLFHGVYYLIVSQTYRPWYHLPIVATVVLVGSQLMDQILGRRTLWAALALVLGVHAIALTTYLQRARRFATSRSAEGRIEWLERHCGQRARVGVMNAGKLAYLAGFRSSLVIINLDGVVNNALLEAYRSKSFVKYYCENVDCALELPAPSVFRDPELRVAVEDFRRTMVEQVTRHPQTLYRVWCAPPAGAPSP